jgi:hypothetical protein
MVNLRPSTESMNAIVEDLALSRETRGSSGTNDVAPLNAIGVRQVRIVGSPTRATSVLRSELLQPRHALRENRVGGRFESGHTARSVRHLGR